MTESMDELNTAWTRIRDRLDRFVRLNAVSAIQDENAAADVSCLLRLVDERNGEHFAVRQAADAALITWCRLLTANQHDPIDSTNVVQLVTFVRSEDPKVLIRFLGDGGHGNVLQFFNLHAGRGDNQGIAASLTNIDDDDRPSAAARSSVARGGGLRKFSNPLSFLTCSTSSSHSLASAIRRSPNCELSSCASGITSVLPSQTLSGSSYIC